MKREEESVRRWSGDHLSGEAFRLFLLNRVDDEQRGPGCDKGYAGAENDSRGEQPILGQALEATGVFCCCGELVVAIGFGGQVIHQARAGTEKEAGTDGNPADDPEFRIREIGSCRL